MIDLLQTANIYAELGYSVFPIKPGGKTPITEHGLKDATTDCEKVEKWWAATPNANIAVVTNGLLVVDVDCVNGQPNTWLADEPDKLSDLAAAPISLTPRGGRHYWFRQPGCGGFGSTAGTLAPNVDTRADGGYVVAPDSVGPGGVAYRWLGDSIDCGPRDLPEPPQWLLDLLGKKRAGRKKLVAGNRIPEGQRNNTLFKLGRTMRDYGMSAVEILAAIERVNLDRCQPPLPPDEVADIAHSAAKYDPAQGRVAYVENWAEQDAAENEREYFIDEPAPTPVEMLRVPGFVSELMDYTLATAPYPNQPLAFAGALAMLGLLAGRKVCDPSDNRTNVYCLGLAHSGSGKDQPRKTNARLLQQLGLSGRLGTKIASGEGLQDALFYEPAMLFQTDEIDSLLQTIAKSKDARGDGIMAELLELATSASSTYALRRKAGSEARIIDQPCLVMFGTAIPNHYYGAMTEKMLTNGFLARMLIFEAGSLGRGQEPPILPIPERIIETAKAWVTLKTHAGNLEPQSPRPLVIPRDDDAKALQIDTQRDCEDIRREAMECNDAVTTTIWARCDEHIRKLALLYAISESFDGPRISRQGVEWARDVVYRQARRMLFQAKQHVSSSPFHDMCNRVKKHLLKAANRIMAHSRLLTLMHVDTVTLAKVVQTLQAAGDLAIEENVKTGGRSATNYRLLRM